MTPIRNVALAVFATALAGAMHPTAEARQTSTAATPVTVDRLKDEPDRYVGQTVVLDGDVTEIFGPRLFAVAEKNFGATPTLLVFVSETLAAGVREQDHVTLTGTVRRFMPSRFEGQWGWFPLDPATEKRLTNQLVVEATKIGGNRVVMLAPTTRAPEAAPHEIPPSPTATAGKPEQRTAVTLTDPARLVVATDSVVGRTVALHAVGVSALTRGGGFLVNAAAGQVLILPAPGLPYSPGVGDLVDVEGVVLRLPAHARASVTATARTNGDVYVYARGLKKQ